LWDPSLNSVLERLKSERTYGFPGGIHPAEFKTLSNTTVIRRTPLPKSIYLTVKQHVGNEGQVLVKSGDKVLKGQALTRSTNPLSVPVHAPTSGTVTTIEPHVSAHPSGMAETTIKIEPDGEDSWTDLKPLKDYQTIPKPDLVEAICKAGIAGMGGAGFPTHIKLGSTKDVEYLIINGVECEPYITADDRLMREHAWQIRQGIDVLTHILNPKLVIIAVEDNKPQALEAMRVACQENSRYLVSSLPTKYPSGGEKQLIQLLLNKEVPSGGLPIDIGVLMHNVGTCFAIADAIFTGKPLIERVITLTGKALNKPGNAWALLGTPMSHLLQFAEYDDKKQNRPRLIMGGPMMGFALNSDQVPVVKVSNCLLVPTEQEIPPAEAEQACIRCGACADACPAGLLPQQLYWHGKAKELDKAQEYDLFDCIECGACAYVCPSQIPLVQYYRQSKATIRENQKEQEKANKARERFEARQARLEREKLEREEKHKLAAEARKKRAASASQNAMKETSNEAEATGTSDAKSKVAAALARAKAKKQQQSQNNTQTVSTQEPESKTEEVESAPKQKSAAVRAAIERAKAKKLQQESQPTANLKDEENNDVETEDDPVNKPEAPKQKSAAVQAAIARAKAKKLAAQQNNDNEQASSGEHELASTSGNALERPVDEKSETNEQSPEDKKKARVAAAIAKAKAKKLASANTDTTNSNPDDGEAD
jgi:electron transport complex protein RnfC